MKVVFHEDFYEVYTCDPASAAGRIEAIVKELAPRSEFIPAEYAREAEIAAVHSHDHIESVRREGLFEIASRAAGAAVQAARIGMREPVFALIRPPGHHASSSSAWGFCFFNNMAVALTVLKQESLISTAFVLDIDLHFGDGNVNILGDKDWVTILNPSARTRQDYIAEVSAALEHSPTDIIGISAGFDHHVDDWGGLLHTDDYRAIGAVVRQAAGRARAGCFAILEGGYNHDVLGRNVAALLDGMQAGQSCTGRS